MRQRLLPLLLQRLLLHQRLLLCRSSLHQKLSPQPKHPHLRPFSLPTSDPSPSPDCCNYGWLTSQGGLLLKGRLSAIAHLGKSFLQFPTWERFPAIAHLGKVSCSCPPELRQRPQIHIMKVCIRPYSLLTYLPVCHTYFYIRGP